ncbi:hypothetical protein E2P81_ATG12021 [Venturia nashicola]|uniref:Uncharacterized protein n=1 Tax=Venturia nashicola TaxID=86259 RepID=A0A4Z1P4F6_9PEZI|nr:hypothetical protein E6O75_ATG11721 [Venturia nashicola]TLD24685.1 hypothetical protein E2P81_ATG12021 [Venturia nashicola]
MADAPLPSIDATPVPDTNGAHMDPDVQMKEEPYSEPSVQPVQGTTAPFLPMQHQSTTSTAPTTPAARPSPAPQSFPPLPPKDPSAHGAPTRVYLNQKVTPYLLEGMKHLAVYEPDKPLKWLAEFLEQKSREVEEAG